MSVELSEILKVERFNMKITGIWPAKDKSLFGKIQEFLSFFFAIALSFTMIIQCCHCLDDFEKLSEILYITATMISYVVKLTTFKMRDRYFFEMMEQIEDVSRYHRADSSELVAKSAKMSTALCVMYHFVVLMTGLTFGIFPLFENDLLPFPFPYFNSGPFRNPFIAFQFVGINFSAWNNTSLDLLASGFMIIASTQLDIVKNNVKNVINSYEYGKDERAVEKDLRRICIHHSKIIDFVKNIERLFTIGTLAQFSSSIVCICNTGFCFLIISWKSVQIVSLLLYFAAMISQLSFYCWFGNEIILKSTEVGEACYDSNWYRLSPRLNKYVFLIIERTKRPLVITAFKFATLSLATFTSIMHWSYSYYALLRRLYQGQ